MTGDISIYTRGHSYNYELHEIVRLFIDHIYLSNKRKCNDKIITGHSYQIISSLVNMRYYYVIKTKLIFNNAEINYISFKKIKKTKYLLKSKPLDSKEQKRLLKIALFKVLRKKYPEKKVPWGILTGIRPTKLFVELKNKSYSDEQAINSLEKLYFVKKEKGKLLSNIYSNQKPYLNQNKYNIVDIYISIPFCPTRCFYCSFPSNSAKNALDLIDKYFAILIYELELIGKLLKNNKINIKSIYIGGGTPSILSNDKINKLMISIYKFLSYKYINEITFEAGRPDTINNEKLKILRYYNVDRICINPQTLNNKTLSTIGRSHTIFDLYRAIEITRNVGIPIINMDFIIGLPGEKIKDLKNNLKFIQKINPENVTIHNLAVKKASDLKTKLNNYNFPNENEIELMLDTSREFLKKINLEPYYLYRQKNMLGHFENIGYSYKGKECIYNIDIIDENTTIIGLGAGAVTKAVCHRTNEINRIPNVKNVTHYIERIEEMIRKKISNKILKNYLKA